MATAAVVASALLRHAEEGWPKLRSRPPQKANCSLMQTRHRAQNASIAIIARVNCATRRTRAHGW